MWRNGVRELGRRAAGVREVLNGGGCAAGAHTWRYGVRDVGDALQECKRRGIEVWSLEGALWAYRCGKMELWSSGGALLECRRGGMELESSKGVQT